MVAMNCNPSSGTVLYGRRGWVQTLAMKNCNCLIEFPPYSYYIRVLDIISLKNAILKSRLPSQDVERKVAGSIPLDEDLFLAIFNSESCDNDVLYMCLFSLGWQI